MQLPLFPQLLKVEAPLMDSLRNPLRYSGLLYFSLINCNTLLNPELALMLVRKRQLPKAADLELNKRSANRYTVFLHLLFLHYCPKEKEYNFGYSVCTLTLCVWV